MARPRSISTNLGPRRPECRLLCVCQVVCRVRRVVVRRLNDLPREVLLVVVVVWWSSIRSLSTASVACFFRRMIFQRVVATSGRVP